MKVTLFGRLADMIGRELNLHLGSGCTIADVRSEIARLYPDAAAEMRSSRVRALINDALAGDDRLAAEGDEIAFLPPLSGG
jgi:molybdopterin converting factor small subunit